MAIKIPTNILTLFEYARENGVELSIRYDHLMDAYKVTMEDLYNGKIRRGCVHYIPNPDSVCNGGEMVAYTLDRMLHELRNVKED